MVPSSESLFRPSESSLTICFTLAGVACRSPSNSTVVCAPVAGSCRKIFWFSLTLSSAPVTGSTQYVRWIW